MTLKELLEAGSVDNLPSIISAIERIDAADLDFDTTCSIRFLRNFTIELIEPFLKYRIYEAGIRPAVNFGGYDTVLQELLQSGNADNAGAASDLTVISLMLDRLDPEYRNPGWTADRASARTLEIFDLAAEKSDSLIAVNTFIPPFYRTQGIATLDTTSDSEGETRRLNDIIRSYVAEHADRFFLIDWERLLRILGEHSSVDYRYWYLSHAPFKNAFLDLYASEIARIARIAKGKIKKCVVLDCDNTLWGGVIGEAGIDGIQLDPNEWPGKAFYHFQQSLLHLFERGIIIAICSKNNEEEVWDVLDNHPHCLLGRKHIAASTINWNNKADNIVSLSQSLNLGLDSLVFVDDDPAQIELIKQALPEVTCVLVPEQLYKYPDILIRAGYFDTLTTSEEDRKRTQFYQAQAKRSVVEKTFANIDEYLKSLEMRATIHPARTAELPRVAQLTQKTNQFNLTTRRYTEPEILHFDKDPEVAIFTLSVSDKFGQLGLTGILIAKLVGQRGEIDTFLLSCRVLGRELEFAFLEQCLRSLEQHCGIKEWAAEYIPTPKNVQTADFWEKAGFRLLTEDVSGRKSYTVEAGQRPRYRNSAIEIIQD